MHAGFAHLPVKAEDNARGDGYPQARFAHSRVAGLRFVTRVTGKFERAGKTCFEPAFSVFIQRAGW
jgi:hypothetical protein